jgi:hypothetical protein
MNQKLKDDLQMQLHRARIGLIDFKKMIKDVEKKGYYTRLDFLILSEIALASKDFVYSLELNKLTVFFKEENLN